MLATASSPRLQAAWTPFLLYLDANPHQKRLLDSGPDGLQNEAGHGQAKSGKLQAALETAGRLATSTGHPSNALLRTCLKSPL